MLLLLIKLEGDRRSSVTKQNLWQRGGKYDKGSKFMF